MSAPFRELENRVRGFPPLVRELVLRYVEENPEAANDPHLVMHALILPLCRGSKDKQDVWDERLGWAFFERLLQVGARRPGGVRLSPAEYKLLLQVIRGERKPIRGKRPARRDSEIADYLELLKADGGWPPEAAVAKAQEVYGVLSRETVYAAKRKRKKEAALLMLEPKGRDMTAEVRRNQIEFQEQQAAKWRRPKRRRRSPILSSV
jgi:hypothetical protein